jgi:hypothetical protein
MKKTTWLSLLILLAPTMLSAQGVPLPPQLPAAAEPPPEVREMQQRERQARPDPLQRVTREHALQVLERLQPGATRPENLPAEALPAAEPPAGFAEVEERERQVRAVRDPGPPTREQLIGKIRELPGGAERLQEARRQGAPITAETSRLQAALAWLNPFAAREAWARSNFSVTVTATNRVSTNPAANLRGYGNVTWPSHNRLDLWPRGGTFAGMTHSRENPYAEFYVAIPADGWYIISFRGVQSGSGARLVHGGSIVASWDYASSSWESYPTVLRLSQGGHWFRFVNISGWLEVESATAFSL